MDVSLTRAITDGNIAAVRSLVAAGSDVNSKIGGQTPLILAVAFRRTEIVNVLLEAGANPHLRDGQGMNAIDWAQRKGFAEEAVLLAQKSGGADNISTNNRDSDSAIPETAARTQISEPTPCETRESKDRISSHEKSQRWLAGLRKRLEEQQSLRANERPTPAAEVGVKDRTEEEPWPVAVPADTAGASMMLHTSEVVPSLPDKTSDVATGPSEQPTALPVSQEVLAVPQAPPSAIESPTSTGRRHCPKCNSIYNSELLAYCPVDMTPLVAGDIALIAPAPGKESRVLIWFFLGATFIAAWGLTSLIVSDLRRWQDPAVQTSPSPTDNVNEVPVVSGGLSGKEVGVPNPDYPATSQGEHVSGKVTVRVTVNKEGKVTDARVIEGDKRLREAAVSAARKATFSPEKLNGKATVGTISYTLK